MMQVEETVAPDEQQQLQDAGEEEMEEVSH